jgi:hypothetical protein
VIRDCSEDGKLDRHYSQHELAKALDTLPSDIDEYTDCRTVIRHAQLNGARGRRGKQADAALAGGGSPPSAHERRDLEAARAKPGSVKIGGKTVTPGETGNAFEAAGLGTDIPLLMLIALIGTAAAMLWGVGFASMRRWPQAWQAAGATVTGSLRGLRERVRRGVTRFRR